MSRGEVWKWYLTAILLLYLCMITHCKKHSKGEAYGDLGDEIVADLPTHTNRKNQIPKGRPNSHKIETRTITKRTFGRYLNPLYSRQYPSAPAPYRRPLRIIPVRTNPIRPRPLYRPIPPWTKKQFIPPWSKKNTIHRPLGVRSPSIANNYARAPQAPRGRAPAAARPGSMGVARKKWYPPRVIAPRSKYRAPGSLRPRYLPKPGGVNGGAAKPKHRMHVQVLPPRAPINPANAKRLGIHSGFVLLPARSQKPNAKTYAQKSRQPRPALRKPKAGPPSRVSNDRFTEKKHIWIPLDSQHMDPRRMPGSDMASYHIDEIGNLIPDISNPRYYEPPSNEMCRSPMKRDGRCPSPSPRSADNKQRWMQQQNYPAPKTNVAHNRILPPLQSHHAPQPRRPPSRSEVKSPWNTRPAKPRTSSQRILYFSHNQKPASKASPRDTRFQQTRSKPPVARTARPRPPFRLQSPRAPNRYEVPSISNKVYQYINERTAPAAAAAAQNAMRSNNPLLKYLQYHRAHPQNNAPGQMLQPSAGSNRIDKRSIVTYRPLRTERVQRRSTAEEKGDRRQYNDQAAPFFQPMGASPYQSPSAVSNVNEDDINNVPWNFYHNEIIPDGRIRPALYPISHHIPFGKCLPDGSLCDKGHDEQCCGASAFCQDYWGISKCVAYAKVTDNDIHNPLKIQENRRIKFFYKQASEAVG